MRVCKQKMEGKDAGMRDALYRLASRMGQTGTGHGLYTIISRGSSNVLDGKIRHRHIIGERGRFAPGANSAAVQRRERDSHLPCGRRQGHPTVRNDLLGRDAPSCSLSSRTLVLVPPTGWVRDLVLHSGTALPAKNDDSHLHPRRRSACEADVHPQRGASGPAAPAEGTE